MLPINEFRLFAGKINTAVQSLVRTQLLSPTSIYELMCLLTSLNQKKSRLQTSRQFWDHQIFSHPKKMGKVKNKHINTSQTNSTEKKTKQKNKKRGNNFFQKKFPWKQNNFPFELWGSKPGKPWTKPLSLVIRCCKAWHKSCGEVLWRSWSRWIFQSRWGVWTLEEITRDTPNLKVTFGTLKLKEWKKLFQEMLGGCCWMVWEAFGQIATKNVHPKDAFDGFTWFHFAVSIGD